MKNLIIQSQQYNYLLKAYQENLQVLGYASGTVQSWPVHVREFLHYLETTGVQGIAMIEAKHITDFISHVKTRANKRYSCHPERSEGTALSSSSINKIINAVNVFIKFLNSSGHYVTANTAERAEASVSERSILTVAEIKQLYESTYLPQRENTAAYGQRDRAMIAIFYGCGLRRSEGIQLNTSDVDLVKRLVFVRRGKGNKQRYVPIAAKHTEDLKDYIENGREWMMQQHGNTWHQQRHGKPYDKKPETDTAAFFINIQGQRMQSFYQRLALMKDRAGIQKPLTLHGLRHSIATHLLQSGMDIEAIAKFLGHSSLVSTQIYTHIINEYDNNI
jgi:integrase/recombinase XerD